MKKLSQPALPVLLAALGAGLLLASCASLPAPRSDSDALVVGYLQLEFPDGYLGQPPRVIRSDILLHFRNVTRRTHFARFTRDGYFAFRVPGGQELRLASYEYSANDPSYQSYLNDQIGIRFSAAPGEVLDLGRLTIRYTAPAKRDRVTFARSVYTEDMDTDKKTGRRILAQYQQYWSYLRTLDRRWDPAALNEYLHRRDPAGRWQSREIRR
jgi:hypothetical protein